ncbi:MAG: hypothetical protein JNJ46_11305 [Myxococcales bacterium]|nr:hypothetical protein [Myxococcales bacterium]
MSSFAIDDASDCPVLDALLPNDTSVHLIVHVRGDWGAQREARVREAEERTETALAYARSAAFRTRFPGRIGVVRMQTDGAVPSVVASVFAERGIEIEDVSAKAPEDGPRCAFCGRDKLLPEQAAMTDGGWSCPSCFRAWTLRTQPQLDTPRRRIIIPPWLLWSALAVLGLLFLFAVGNELRYLTHMNRIIRQHIPSQ